MPSLERGQSAMCGCVGQKLARGSFVGAAPCSSSVLSMSRQGRKKGRIVQYISI